MKRVVASAWRRVPYGPELAGLAALLVVPYMYPKGVPAAIYVYGGVFGASSALYVLGILLVFRANRIINFAQLTLGSLPATLFALSVTYRPALRWISPMCSGGCSGPVARQINYWVSLVLALAVAVGLGWLTHALVVHRFEHAPRLVLTVATVFVGLFVNYLARLLPNFLTTQKEQQTGLAAFFRGTPPPVTFHWTVGGVTLDTRALTTIAAAAIAFVSLTVFLRRSAIGVAMRATATSPSRAATLGLDVGAVNARVWMISSGLSGVAALLATMGPGDPRGSGLALSFLVRVLTIAVIARLMSLPIAALAALVLGVVESATFWQFSASAPFEGALFFIVSGFLLLQRRGLSRSDLEAASAWSDSRELRPIPGELRRLPVVRGWVLAGTLTCGAVVVAAPFVLSPSQNSQASSIMAAAMLGLSLLVLTGWAGQISLGQFAFAAVGAWVVVASKLTFLLAVPLAGLAGLVVAVIVGLPALRLRGLHLAITSLAFALFAAQVLLNPSYLGSHVKGQLASPSLFGIRIDSDRGIYYLTLSWLALMTAAAIGLRRSRTARALIAARDNERAAQSFGVDILRARIIAFAVSGLFAAIAGALLAYQQSGVQASTFSLDSSVSVFQNTVIGGLGSITGPFLGVLYGGLPALLGLPAWVTDAATLAIGLLIILAVPGGISRVAYDVRDVLLRRVASRQRIVVPSLVADVADGDVELISLAPNVETDGRRAYVPRRYRLSGQWALSGRDGVTGTGSAS